MAWSSEAPQPSEYLLAPETRDQSNIALVDGISGAAISYGQLTDRLRSIGRSLSDAEPSLVLCLVGNDVDSVVGYLGAMAAGHAVALLDSALPEAFLIDLAKRYRPGAITGRVPRDVADQLTGLFRGTGEGSDGFLLRVDGEYAKVHPDLALLLATSGTTGSPKLVRLSKQAIQTNARAIATSVGICADERAITPLPIHYTYGLSILHSHLVAGATTVVTDASVVEQAFWDQFRSHRCTSLAGVPYTYQTLRRLGFDPKPQPSLRYATQAGGRLSDALRTHFHERLTSGGRRFLVMYGQTEATARMAVLPSELLPAKLSAAGLPIPGGRFSVNELPGLPHGEIVYHGPNVMMGYAHSAEDLASGDELGGRLLTGDLGYVDDDGVLFVTGRVKRIAKVFGTRVSLDDVEAMIRNQGPVAAIEGTDNLRIFCEFGSNEELRRLAATVAAQLRVHHSGVRVTRVDKLPLAPSGKIDYGKLQEWA